MAHCLTVCSSISKAHEFHVLRVLSKAKFYNLELLCCDDVARSCLNHVKGRNIDIKASHNKKLNHTTYKLMSVAEPSDLYIANTALKDADVEQLLLGVKESGAKLRFVSLDGNKSIGYQGFRSIVDFIHCSQLQRLRVKYCDLDDERIKTMAEHSSGRQFELLWFDISKNQNIGPDGCKHFVDFLKQTKHSKLSMCDSNMSSAKLKAISDQLKATNLEIPELDMSENIPSDSHYMDQMTELISSGRFKQVVLKDCRLTVDCVNNFCKGLMEKEIVLESLDLSQNAPNPEKEYLLAICRLLFCVSDQIRLYEWRFDDEDLVTLRNEMQKSPNKQLQVSTTNKFGEVLWLTHDWSDKGSSPESDQPGSDDFGESLFLEAGEAKSDDHADQATGKSQRVSKPGKRFRFLRRLFRR